MVIYPYPGPSYKARALHVEWKTDFTGHWSHRALISIAVPNKTIFTRTGSSLIHLPSIPGSRAKMKVIQKLRDQTIEKSDGHRQFFLVTRLKDLFKLTWASEMLVWKYRTEWYLDTRGERVSATLFIKLSSSSRKQGYAEARSRWYFFTAWVTWWILMYLNSTRRTVMGPLVTMLHTIFPLLAFFYHMWNTYITNRRIWQRNRHLHLHLPAVAPWRTWSLVTVTWRTIVAVSLMKKRVMPSL